MGNETEIDSLGNFFDNIYEKKFPNSRTNDHFYVHTTLDSASAVC